MAAFGRGQFIPVVNGYMKDAYFNEPSTLLKWDAVPKVYPFMVFLSATFQMKIQTFG